MKSSTFSGSVTIRERITIGEAILTVKLVDRAGEVLAATASDVTAVPAVFELTVDPALIHGAEHVRLWAMLRTPHGVWGTRELMRLGEDMVLSRVED